MTEKKIFHQGDAFLVNFQPGKIGIYGRRPAVCLHDSASVPGLMALVAPITSLYNKYGERKTRSILTDVALYKEKYPDGPIDKDSLVLVHEVRMVHHSELTRYLGRLHDRDIQQIKYSLILLFGMENLIEKLAKSRLEMAGE